MLEFYKFLLNKKMYNKIKDKTGKLTQLCELFRIFRCF